MAIRLGLAGCEYQLQITAAFDFAEIEFGGECGEDGFRGVGLGFIAHADFELHERAEFADVVEGDFHRETFAAQLACAALLADDRCGCETETTQDLPTRGQGIGPVGEAHLMFDPRLGVGIELGAFVSERSLGADGADAEGFVGLGEITLRMGVVAIDLRDRVGERCPLLEERRFDGGEIRDAVFLFDFKRHQQLQAQGWHSLGPLCRQH